MSDTKFTAIDLFSGAGGLTLGLKNAGFKVVAAVEINKEITKTYAKNHPEVKIFAEDLRKITGKDILKATGLRSIDLVAGCPPCQGFSKLTDKYHRNDSRNELVVEMARIVKELSPTVCMVENVPGLAKRGMPLLSEFESQLAEMGYIITKGVLQVADYGVPQSRKRLVLLAGKGFKIDLPLPTHSKNSSSNSPLKPWIIVRDVLRKNNKPVTISRARLNGGPKEFNWNVVRDIKPITIERLKFLSPGGSRESLPIDLRPNCHKTAKGFSNVYGRMDWNTIAPTITSGCLTLSSGRFGHPEENRTISIREAATLQTFPSSYQFDTENIAIACDLVGNALPPRFAKVVSSQCYNALINK